MERYAVHVGNIGCVESDASLTRSRAIAAKYRGQIIRTQGHCRAEWPVWIERLSDGAPVAEWTEASILRAKIARMMERLHKIEGEGE